MAREANNPRGGCTVFSCVWKDMLIDCFKNVFVDQSGGSWCFYFDLHKLALFYHIHRLEFMHLSRCISKEFNTCVQVNFVSLVLLFSMVAYFSIISKIVHPERASLHCHFPPFVECRGKIANRVMPSIWEGLTRRTVILAILGRLREHDIWNMHTMKHGMITEKPRIRKINQFPHLQE